MLYTVKYKQEKFKVTLKNKIKIERIKLLLFIKRAVRRGRIFIPHNVKMYILLTFCWILYGTIVYFIGKVYKASETYGICDVVWELKNSYFTSVVLAIFIGGYNQITNYKEKINAQHDFYTDVMSCFEQIFSPILGDKLCNYYAFYNDKCLENTFEYISSEENHDYIWEENYDDIIEDIFIQLDKIDEVRKNNRIVGMHKDKLRDYIYDARKTLKKYNQEKKINVEGIKEISQKLFYIIADIRRPWRWDVDNDVKILRYLNENEANGIENDFYYRMHLNGHKFSSKL